MGDDLLNEGWRVFPRHRNEIQNTGGETCLQGVISTFVLTRDEKDSLRTLTWMYASIVSPMIRGLYSEGLQTTVLPHISGIATPRADEDGTREDIVVSSVVR